MLTKKANLEDIDQLSRLFDQYRQLLNKHSDLISIKLFLSERITKNECVIIVAEMPDRSFAGFVHLVPFFLLKT